MAHTYLTIGHSTRTLSEFVALLQEAGATHVADVRTVPRSRTNPQYNREALPAALAPHGIGYTHIPPLGGLRGKAKSAPSAANAFWENASFHNYADHAMGAAFRAGLDELRALATDARPAIMCAEAVWWRCHRRIIADYLLATGDTVLHIMGPGKIAPARINPAARIAPDGTLTYPAHSP